MAKPSEKLAESLKVLHTLQARDVVAIRSADLTRTHRGEHRLVRFIPAGSQRTIRPRNYQG